MIFGMSAAISYYEQLNNYFSYKLYGLL